MLVFRRMGLVYLCALREDGLGFKGLPYVLHTRLPLLSNMFLLRVASSAYLSQIGGVPICTARRLQLLWSCFRDPVNEHDYV